MNLTLPFATNFGTEFWLDREDRNRVKLQFATYSFARGYP
jgi:hypothetical protein